MFLFHYLYDKVGAVSGDSLHVASELVFSRIGWEGLEGHLVAEVNLKKQRYGFG